MLVRRIHSFYVDRFTHKQMKPYNWKALGPAHFETAAPSSYVLPCWICLFYVKHSFYLYYLYVIPYKRIYRDPPEKYDISRPAFQGHSRSSEPTRIDPLPVIF